EFCARVSRMANKTYRLPSEAEWEYACRGGTTTPFYCGETISTDLANYDGNYTYGQGQKGEYREKTTEVGKFPANPFGLYDMCGNVWEWCEDGWHENYINAPIDGTAWTSLSSIQVLRGGSWIRNPQLCRSASRYGYFRGERDSIYSSVGFRVVCVVGRIIR
ncbi:MAG: formylglycine-generating enzyme family protein, partial [Dolichospermum sp.]